MNQQRQTAQTLAAQGFSVLSQLYHQGTSLLLANGVPMKQIQEWLGHSDFSTTANVYAHLDYHSKITSAETILTGLKMQPEA